MKKTLSILLLFLNLCAFTSYSQSQSNLEITLNSPEYGAEIEVGDTVEIKYSVKNLGPDDLLETDTFTVGLENIPVMDIFHEHLAVGDSIIYSSLFFINNGNESYTDSFTNCFYIINENTRYSDTDQTNDTACVLFYFLGNDQSNIINAPHKSEILGIYPNPTNSYINIDVKDISSKSFIINIVTLSGSEIWSKEFSKTNQEEIKIDISETPKGIYFIRLKNEDVNKTGKLLIH